MTTEEAIAWAGSARRLARILNVTDSAISQWDEYPPLSRQYEISAKSGNTLSVTVPEKQKAPTENTVGAFVSG